MYLLVTAKSFLIKTAWQPLKLVSWGSQTLSGAKVFIGIKSLVGSSFVKYANQDASEGSKLSDILAKSLLEMTLIKVKKITKVSFEFMFDFVIWTSFDLYNGRSILVSKIAARWQKLDFWNLVKVKKKCKESFTNFFLDFIRVRILSIKRHLVDEIVMKWINFDFCLFFRMNPTRISCVTTIGVSSYAFITFWANVWPRCTTKLSSSPVKKPRTKRIEKSLWRLHLDSNQRVSLFSN